MGGMPSASSSRSDGTAAASSSAKRFEATARRAAATVIRGYSTSFSRASRTLPAPVRRHIEAIYAVVRIADEIVDGAWGKSEPASLRDELDAFAARVAAAAETGASSDLICTAFAATARRCGIGPAQWEPFFASMRTDIDTTDHDAESLAAYIHGSAEVVGEMCVLAFLDGAALPAERREELMAGARALGSAFQKVNFLRDIGHDTRTLGRHYLLPAGEALDEERLDELVSEIGLELATAAEAVDLLPARVRPAVWTAWGLFAELTSRLAAAGPEAIMDSRIRVSDARKAVIAAGALAGREPLPRPGLPSRFSTRKPSRR